MRNKGATKSRSLKCELKRNAARGAVYKSDSRWRSDNSGQEKKKGSGFIIDVAWTERMITRDGWRCLRN